jgi:molecular chaperone GrpE (heat shock protein)
VTSKVSVWYSEHSTPNPLGVWPPHTVRIISDNKFAANAFEKERKRLGEQLSEAQKQAQQELQKVRKQHEREVDDLRKQLAAAKAVPFPRLADNE